MERREVYLDHAALAPLDKRVFLAMEPYLKGGYGNPSSIYTRGRATRDKIGDCRTEISWILHCQSDEIVFTSGGTESDNLAILGVARANSKSEILNSKQIQNSDVQNSKLNSMFQNSESRCKGHIITTQFEHHAVLNACKQLESEGFEVTYLPVDKDGLVKLEDIKQAIRPETILISIMYANNEIGTVQPIAEIGNWLKTQKSIRQLADKSQNNGKIYFHTDACQAAGYLDLDVNRLNVDLLTSNGTKIYGPTGIGILYVRNGVKIQPVIFGGGQQGGLRSGTENILGIVGFTEALKIADRERTGESARLAKLRDYLIDGVLTRISNTGLNGSKVNRLPGNANFSFYGVEGEAMVLMLDEEGIAVSTGSACNSDSLEPSHVLKAIGLSHEGAHGSLRFSLGRRTTKQDIDYVLAVLPSVVSRLRSISAIRSDKEKI
ncbi:MAG: cysteine desulfurase family protein [bacterium]|nr:cysteine desulfurase family protein [bacterium]